MSFVVSTMASGSLLRCGKVVPHGSESCEPAHKLAKVAKPKTRSSSEVFLVGQPSASISGSKLPTNRQVFQYFLYLKQDTPRENNESLAYDMVDAVLPFWNMARIKTVTRQNAMLNFMKMHEKHRKLCRNRGRESDPEGKRASFCKELNRLFDIAAPDAIDEIRKNRLLTNEKKEEDVNFYTDQKGDRRAHMSGHDKIFESKSQQQSQRREREEERFQLVATRDHAIENEESLDTDGEDDDGSSGVLDIRDTDYHPPISCTSKNATTINLEFPRAVMSCEEICSTADRLALSDNQTTAMVAAVLKAGGADLSDFTISTSTARRSRINARYSLSENYMKSFSEKPPKYLALHWDGKLLKDVLGANPGDSVESLAVLVSGSPQYQEGKLLGVPFIESSSGIAQANASMDLLVAWGLTGNIVALVFDTTASNSGIRSGSAKLLEDRLDKKMFYLACRHHVLELIVGAAWEVLFGKIKSPDNPWFKELKDTWAELTKEEHNALNPTNFWLRNKKKKALSALNEILESSASPRADYREVAELCIILLGKEPPRGIHWAKPGAIHQARWMARNIYSMKMFMFSHELGYSEDTISKLERLNTFLGLFYTTYWMTASSAADAPLHDLQFMKDMMQFKQHDPQLATAVLNKARNHLWYLTQEVVPFALFSSKLSSLIKNRLLQKL